jgi:hypothetical protein
VENPDSPATEGANTLADVPQPPVESQAKRLIDPFTGHSIDLEREQEPPRAGMTDQHEVDKAARKE